MTKNEYLIWQCDTSLDLVSSLLTPNGHLEITLTSLTALLAIMKYVIMPKSAAVKDIDIADILAQKYRYRHRDIDPPLIKIIKIKIINILGHASCLVIYRRLRL